MLILDVIMCLIALAFAMEMVGLLLSDTHTHTHTHFLAFSLAEMCEVHWQAVLSRTRCTDSRSSFGRQPRERSKGWLAFKTDASLDTRMDLLGTLSMAFEISFLLGQYLNSNTVRSLPKI